MRVAVVVIVCAAACTKPVPQPPECATYVGCYFDDDGYLNLATTIRDAPTPDPDLACYGGLAVALKEERLDKIIDPMRRAYDVDGTCWAGGYAPVSDRNDLERKYAADCEQHCRLELAAECARVLLDKTACPGDEAVDAFCKDPDNAELIEGARCPEPVEAAAE